MGMVLLEYDPVKVCWEYTDNPEDVEWMRRELFDSKEWSLLDEGTLTDAQALERVQKRLPNEHLRWLAKESLEHWHEYNIWAKPGMGELVKELKEKGCGSLSPSCSSILEKSTERRFTRGGVPVLKRRISSPSSRRQSPKVAAANMPSGPPSRKTSPTIVRPFK